MYSKLPPPSKSWGQNYLINRGVKQKIINAMEVERKDILVEIGAGRGALTEMLVKKGNSVFAIEPHLESFEYLQTLFGKYDNLRLIQKDASVFDFSEILKDKNKIYKVVGNLPYNVSTKIFSNLILTSNIAFVSVFMFQKEVAKRLTAVPGTKDYGALSVFASLNGKTEMLFDVSPGSFYPKPKVFSSVIKFYFYPNEIDWNKFKPVLQSIFSQRRKNIANALKSVFDKKKTEEIIDLWERDRLLRPESLFPKDYFDLYMILERQKLV